MDWVVPDLYNPLRDVLANEIFVDFGTLQLIAQQRHHMGYRDYIAPCTYPRDQILEDWRWLIPDNLELWFVTKFGDAFLRDKATKAIRWLDVEGGKLEPVAETEIQFEYLANEQANLDRWFMPEVVNGQKLLGMEPGENRCLSCNHPLKLGGQLDPDNLDICDIAVHFSVMGQLLQQIKDLPPGTKITDIKIDAPPPPDATKRPWWRFW